MKDRTLPKGLYNRASTVMRELCEWCGKFGSDGCNECAFRKVRTVIELHKKKDRELQEITSKDVGRLSDIL